MPRSILAYSPLLVALVVLAPVATLNAQEAQPGRAKVIQAYELTEGAEDDDVEVFDKVINLCGDALKEGLSEEHADYARRLMSWAHNRRGETWARDGQGAEALDEFEAAIRLDPKRWRALHNRGVSRAMAGDFEAALEDFAATIELNADYANVWYNRAEVYFEQGEFQKAVADYDKALQLNPQDVDALNSRGHARYRLGQYKEALVDYEKAVELKPEDVISLTNRGDAYADLGRYKEAAADYRAAIKADAEYPRSYLGAAWMMATCPDERFRDGDLAVQAARKAAELAGTQDYRYEDTLAAALAEQGRFDEAVAALEEALEKFPEEQRAAGENRLQGYRERKPHREQRRTAKTSGSSTGANDAARAPSGTAPSTPGSVR